MTATDSSAEPSEVITVNINLIDEDEAPTIDLVTGMVDGLNITALPVISHAGGRAIEFAENGAGKVVTFTVSDEDGGTPAVTLSGSSRFSIENVAVPTDNDARVAGNLVFDAPPDFEDPTDSRPTDNIYEVTLVARDGRNTTMLNVTVKVTNVAEDGEVTLAYQQPLIGRALTATVADSDGGFNPASGAPRTAVTDVNWQWQRTVGTYAPEANECLDGRFPRRPSPRVDGPIDRRDVGDLHAGSGRRPEVPAGSGGVPRPDVHLSARSFWSH